MLGDGGEDEWALSNSKLAALLSQAAAADAAAALADGGGRVIRIEDRIMLDTRQIGLSVREFEPARNTEADR
jgi:hypothetical protein